MRKLAWLHAVPDGSKTRKSRYDTYKEADPESLFLQLPDLEGAEYIIGMLHEAGLMLRTGMGPVPLSWQEIDAWMRVTETNPELWERILIKDLSEAYVGELHRASAKDSACPYMPEVEEQEVEDRRTAVSNKLLEALRSMKRNPNPPPQEEST